MRHQRSRDYVRFIQEQHQLGGNNAAPATPAPPPTPPTPPTPPPTSNSQTTAQATADTGKVVAAQGIQSTILSSDVDTNKGVVKNTLLGG